MLKKFNEYFVQAQFEPLTSFRIKDDLNPEVWDGFEMNEEIRTELLKIGKDFFEKVELPIEYVDIALCGSLCNYNWSEKYSDFDLHIIINYVDINDDLELVEKFCDYAKKLWNSDHDIQIKGFDVEVAIQDKEDLNDSIEGGRMGGVFSLLNNKWIKKPTKAKFVPDEDLIRKKAENIMTQINELEDDLENGIEYKEISPKLKKVWKKIKDGRESGLKKEGEYSIENLVFKFLRRNEYISRLLSVKKKSYDKQFK